MNTQINTGGAAFPSAWEEEYGDHGHMTPYHNDGMTLRDYFAAKAMQGICAHEDTWSLLTEDIAIEAYKMADAMLKAREVAS